MDTAMLRYTKGGCIRLARAVLNTLYRDINRSARPRVLADVFFSKRGNSSLFCGLANLDEDTVKANAYRLVGKRERVLVLTRRFRALNKLIKRERFKRAAKMQHYERLVKKLGGQQYGHRKGRRKNTR